MHLFKSIYNGDIFLEDVEKEQTEKDLGRIKQGNPKDKSSKQKKAINNIPNLYNSRKEVAEMFNDYAKNIPKSLYESKQGTELKILTPKQLLQRLPIALAEIKAGNNSESLLNEIGQIVYSLYQAKKDHQKSI